MMQAPDRSPGKSLVAPVPPGSVAVVGMAGRFPAAASVAELWQLLDHEREATRCLTDDELLAAGVSPSTIRDANYVRASLILPNLEMFDAGFFGFSPRDAAILDPQHRHFLECAWEAFEDAGHMPDRFQGSIGVFAGCGMQAYFAYNLLSNPELVESVGLFLLRHTGNDKDFLPTRLSYLLNLQGPSVAVQTACSTSLVAVHMACQSLLTGSCDMALAGGVSIELPHRRGYRFTEGEILSPDGHCRAFDDDAKGTLFGSGAGVVVLRRLEDALESGDNIHLVIRGSAINNDGSQKAGYLAPSVDGQARAAAEAQKNLGLSEAQLVCLLFAPFTEKGAGLERFLRQCHPGMLVAMPELHKAMQGHPVAEQIMQWMIDVSGLPVSLIGRLYRMEWTPADAGGAAEAIIPRAVSQNALDDPDADSTLVDEWSAGH